MNPDRRRRLERQRQTLLDRRRLIDRQIWALEQEIADLPLPEPTQQRRATDDRDRNALAAV